MGVSIGDASIDNVGLGADWLVGSSWVSILDIMAFSDRTEMGLVLHRCWPIK
jgi:hypothetical protein